MRLPSLLEYQRAVQVPRAAFTTVDLLRTGRAVLNAQGMPSVASGGFAATFKIEASSGDRYAVRCFHKFSQHDRNLAERYRRIGAFVAAHPDLDFLIDVVYQDDGITVDGNRFPTVRMQWAEGETLGVWVEDWIEDPHRDPAAIDTVRAAIADAVAKLQKAGAAHGDLQHGNILVRKDLSITLIDYDGMFLHEFTGTPHLQAIEQGHRNYQHPGRGTRFDADGDVFSAAVIDLSLRALQQRPALWEDYGGTGENLIFSAADFVDPANSRVFAELVGIAALAEPVRRLQRACQLDYDHMPTALAGQVVSAPAATGFTVTIGDVFRGDELEELRRRQGQTVTVFGTIQFASVTKGRGGRDVALINLGNYENGDFTIVGYDAVAHKLFGDYGQYTRNNKRVLRKLHGWRVAITGTIVLYEYKGLLVPQIELPRAGLLRNLTPDKITALTAAVINRGTPATATATARRPSSPTVKTMPAATASTTPPSTAAQNTMPRSAAGPATPKTTVTPPNPSDREVARAAGLHDLYRNFPTAPPPTPTISPRTTAAYHQPPPVPSQYRRENLPRPLPQAVVAPPQRRPRRRTRHRRGNLAAAGVLFPAAIVAIGLMIARHHGRIADPVMFQTASHTVTCRIAADGDSAGIRCDTTDYAFTPPPPPPGCAEPGWGHTVALTATSAGFSCVPPAAVDPAVPVLADGATKTAGPYTCTSIGDTITCRDTRPGGHRFRIDRDAYQFD
ncbi:hypothetical protein [Nocardia altamirensis]|uniref:hypothetical protein n=1 Tax=Nocardia altamirensis TaxID=472158 RepID=UPI00084048A8|nr:hypothetical protein [Nocardia altamirensis]